MKTVSRAIPLLLSSFLFISKVWAQSQTIENGSNSTTVTFPGTRCVYNWVNDNPSIGLDLNGTGDIASFKAINTGSVPVTATITATPVNAAGFAYITNVHSRTGGASLKTISVVNTATNQVVTTITVGSEPIGVSASPDGNRVYVTNTFSGSVSVINTSSNTVVSTIPVGSYPWGIVVSPDGSRVYNTNFNNSNISVINTATNSVLGTLPAGPNPYCIAISKDGKRLYVTNYYSNRLTVVDIATSSVIATIGTGTDPRYVTISSDGTKVYVSNSASNSISVINTATNTLSNTITVGSYPEAIVLNLDGSRLYVQNSGSSTVSVINTTTYNTIASISTSRGGHGAALSPDGTRLYVTNSNLHEVTVINTLTNTVLTTLYAGDFPRSVGNFVIGSSGCSPTTFTITINPTLTPLITPSGNLAALNTTYGTPSSSANLILAGVNLTGNVAVTAPVGFEVSTDNNTFSNLINVGTAGTLASTPIYIRLSKGAPANTYRGDITMSSSGAPSVNMAITGVVNPAQLSIQMSQTNKIYGNTLSSSASSTNFVATGLQNSEVIGSVIVSYGTGASPTSLPGIYSNTVSGSAATGGTFSANNYSIVYLPADIIVTAASLIITADNKTKYLGEPNPPLTISYTGFVNNESFAHLLTQPYLSTSAIQTSPAGQYVISVSGASSTQYNITYVSGTLTIRDTETVRIPNTFTPNGDGKNDLWEIRGLIYDQECKMEIYERSGQLVFKSIRYKPWDGTFDGKSLPEGAYYYIINPGQGSKSLTGHVSILR